MEYNIFTPVLPTEVTAPFVPASGGLDDSTSSSKKSRKSSSSSSNRVSIGGLDPNMISYILEHSIPSDAKMFFEQMETAIKAAYNPNTGQTNYAAYKLLLPKIVEMRENYEEFKKAKDTMLSNNAQDEVAITPQGQVYVANRNATSESDLITIKSVYDLTPNDVLITNGTLARYRRDMDSTAFNTQFIESIAQGVSARDITDYINKTIQGITSGSNTSETYRNLRGDIRQGLEILESFNNGEALLKETTKDEQSMVDSSLKYLLTTMPRNMLVILEAHARTRNSSVLDVLKDYITSKTGGDSATKYDVVKGMTEEEGNRKMTTAEAFFYGKTPVHDFVMNVSGGNIGYVGKARESKATDSQDNPLPRFSKLDDVFNGNFGGYLDLHNVSMGGRMVKNGERVILSETTIESVDLPIDPFAYDPNGDKGRSVIIPDFASLPKVKKAEQAIRDKNISPDDKEAINKEYVDAELKPKWAKDSNGNWVLNTRYVRFAVMSGYADEAALSGSSVDLDQSLLTEITNKDNGFDPTADELARKFTVVENGKVKAQKPDKILKGLIFVPMKNQATGYDGSALGAITSTGQAISLGEYQTIQSQQGAQDAKRKYQYVSGNSFSANN